MLAMFVWQAQKLLVPCAKPQTEVLAILFLIIFFFSLWDDRKSSQNSFFRHQPPKPQSAEDRPLLSRHYSSTVLTPKAQDLFLFTFSFP